MLYVPARPLYFSFLHNLAAATCMVGNRKGGCAGINDTSAAFIDAQYSQVFTPDDCSLREFEAENFNTQMQGRRLLFLGDSLMRGNWGSMACLLRDQVTVLTECKACSTPPYISSTNFANTCNGRDTIHLLFQDL